MFLNFNTQNLNPSNVNNRGHGLQLRCLSVFIPFAVRFYMIFSLIEKNFLDFLFCRLLACTKGWAVGNFRMRQHPSKVWLRLPPCTSAIQTSLMALGCCVGFSVPFVYNRRCQRGQCKHGLQIAERRGGTE
ncbi:hypothetical protein [uncultured Rikenella sp.]|uniref:hypothetical protein n=1 Tax=uncultured Rikenella sp. TaxID=368003 RepID=UPI002620BC1B|nr:hypothetical protein [uncultured Rikenella sp.]